MYRNPKEWAPIFSGLRRAIAREVNLRVYRKKKHSSEVLEFWDSYLQALRMLREKLKLYAIDRSPKAYAEGYDLTLSDPPSWADLVPRKVKAAFIQAQGLLPGFERTRTEVFSATPLRRPNGVAKQERIDKHNDKWRAKLDEAMHNEGGHNQEHSAYPSMVEWCMRRSEQLSLAQDRLDNFPKDKRLPKDWLQLLTPEEASMAEFIDDTPRTVAIYPETAQQRAAREQARLEELGLAPPPAANKRPRGRPVGARDSVQRVRRPASEAEKAKIRRSIQQNKAYQGIVRQHEEKS